MFLACTFNTTPYMVWITVYDASGKDRLAGNWLRPVDDNPAYVYNGQPYMYESWISGRHTFGAALQVRAEVNDPSGYCLADKTIEIGPGTNVGDYYVSFVMNEAGNDFWWQKGGPPGIPLPPPPGV